MNAMLLIVFALLLAPAEASETKSPAPETSADLARMQGDWMVNSMKVNGLKHEQQEAESLFRTVKDNTYAISRYSHEILRGSFKLDATQTPRTIDSTPANSPDGTVLLGIYEFDGDKLQICNAPPGKPRPKDFAARIGSQHTMTVWERERK
jgi:uncharacterized protein (TIGR03067 family)